MPGYVPDPRFGTGPVDDGVPAYIPAAPPAAAGAPPTYTQPVHTQPTYTQPTYTQPTSRSPHTPYAPSGPYGAPPQPAPPPSYGPPSYGPPSYGMPLPYTVTSPHIAGLPSNNGYGVEPARKLAPPVLATGLTVGVPIALGGLYQLFFLKLGRNNYGLQTLGRDLLAGTVAFYAIVGLIIIAWLIKTRRHLAWSRGSAVRGAALGLSVGLTGGLLAVAADSGIAHHLWSDPNAVALTSEGDLPHILTTMLILSVAAPLIEETLFRGILMEWFRPFGKRAALVATAAGFVVWHYRFEAWRYYAVMGLLLGGLYWKRGLIASMSAHAAFNGTLGVVAVMIAVTPASTVTVGDLSFTKPQGWHLDQHKSAIDGEEFGYVGPSGAAIAVIRIPASTQDLTAADLLDRVSSGAGGTTIAPGISMSPSSASVQEYPVGEVVEVPLTAGSASGTVDFFVTPGALCEVVFLDAGSAKAQHGFAEMMQSLRLLGTG